jgi:hypothetical protein
VLLDSLHESGPFELAGDGEDGGLRREAGFAVVAQASGGEGFEVVALADGGTAEGKGVVALAEEQREFVRGFVFDGVELLEREIDGRLEAVVGEHGTLNDVGEDGEDGEEVFAEHGAGEAEEDGFGAEGALDA